MAVSISIEITQNSQNISANTSNVTVKVTAKWTGGSFNRNAPSGWLKIDRTKYTFSSDFNASQTTSGSQTLYSKTVNVAHNSDGKKTLPCSASFATGVSSGTVTASASKTLTTIARASTIETVVGTLGTAKTITVTRQSTSFTHSIKAVCGSSTFYIKADGSTSSSEVKHSDCSIPFTPPISLASQNTTGTTVKIDYTLTTYNGTTKIGTDTFWANDTIPSSVKPSCSVAVTDPMGYADEYDGFLKGLSKFKVVVTPTTSYGSAIASYSTTANGATYTAATFTTGVLTSSGTLKVNATVKDKRGRSGTASASLTVLDYSAPKISAFKVKRGNMVTDDSGVQSFVENIKGDCAMVTFSASVTSLNNKNTALYRIEYKKTSESSYISVDLDDYANNYAVTDGTYIFAADTGSSYDVKLSVIDNFNADEPTAKTTAVSTAFSLIHWLANGLGMAIGKIAELSNVLDIGFQTRFSGGILHPVLEPNTDLNDVLIPNTYVGANVSTYNYANCPLTSGTFSLEVIGQGEEGQVMQTISLCHKTASKKYTRTYYQGSWGDWQPVITEKRLYDMFGVSYELTPIITCGPNYSSVKGSLYLVGNNLRLYFNATRASESGAGNITNEVVCTFTANHGGKIRGIYTVGFPSDGTGPLASFDIVNQSTTTDTITFSVELNATHSALSTTSAYASVPVLLNPDAY